MQGYAATPLVTCANVFIGKFLQDKIGDSNIANLGTSEQEDGQSLDGTI